MKKPGGPRPLRALARIAGGLCAFMAAACAPSGSLLRPGLVAMSDSAWLASVGYDRRVRSALVHLERGEMASMHVDSTAQLLARAPRVEVRVERSGKKDYLLHRGADWTTNRSADPGCPLEFYINGNLLRQRIGDLYDLQPDRLFRPQLLTALEVFEAADAPAGPEAGCGVVLLWIARLRHEDDPPFTAALTGRVVRTNGEGLPGVPVRAMPGALTRVTDANGGFSFGYVPAGPYEIEAQVPDWGDYRTSIGLRSNGVGEVTIEVDRR